MAQTVATVTSSNSTAGHHRRRCYRSGSMLTVIRCRIFFRSSIRSSTLCNRLPRVLM
jgi:hypothetical protein